MRRTLQFLLTLAVGAASAHAGIVLTFDQPFRVAQPGDLLHFTAVIANTGADEVFLNGDTIDPLSADFTIDDQFLANVPVSLLGGTDSGSINLFDLQIGNPAYGVYGGSYQLFGGADSGDNGKLAVAEFSVDVVPEPGTMGLMGLAVAGLGFLRLRRRNW